MFLFSAVNLLSRVFRVSYDVWILTTSIFTLYSPVNMDSSGFIDDPNLNLHRQLL